MTTDAPGFLAIWSDVAPAHETDYLHWLTREHTAERVAIAGFRGVRVFRTPGAGRFFILYALKSAAVVDSPAYLARLNAPTPWSTRVMPRLGAFRRGGGSAGPRVGLGAGGSLAVCRLNDPAALDGAEAALPALAATDRICAARILVVDAGRTGVPTREKSLRSGDTAFAGLLLIEGLDGQAVAAAQSTSGLPGELFGQMFSLDRDALAPREENA